MLYALETLILSFITAINSFDTSYEFAYEVGKKAERVVGEVARHITIVSVVMFGVMLQVVVMGSYKLSMYLAEQSVILKDLAIVAFEDYLASKKAQAYQTRVTNSVVSVEPMESVETVTPVEVVVAPVETPIEVVAPVETVSGLNITDNYVSTLIEEEEVVETNEEYSMEEIATLQQEAMSAINDLTAVRDALKEKVKGLSLENIHVSNEQEETVSTKNTAKVNTSAGKGFGSK